MSAFYDSREWQAVRYEALKRSRGHCECCGARASGERPLHVDHVKPRSKYPELSLTLSNLQVLCGACNRGKSNTDETDWRVVVGVNEARLTAAFNLTDEERRARRDLLDRSICGSTHDERLAARKMLDAIEQYVLSAFEERREERK